MTDILPTPRQIERWVPPTLDDIAGCSELKDLLFDHLRAEGQGPNILVSGEPGTGKTASVKAYVKTLMCPQRSHLDLLPCGNCTTCRQFDVRHADVGIFAVAGDRVAVGGAKPVNYYPVNCGSVKEIELRDILDERKEFAGLFLIYLDEVHRIVRRMMDHLLLKPLEELDAVWIASSARTQELDPMFIRRFAARVSTTLPAVEELAVFLAKRCREWRIRLDTTDTLVLLAQRSRRVTAEAIGVLAVAAGRKERVLDRDLVVRYPFGRDK